jgi:hypothetical protein
MALDQAPPSGGMVETSVLEAISKLLFCMCLINRVLFVDVAVPACAGGAS